MSFSPPSPLTGAAVTGLTSPTYTHAADSAPDNNSIQRYVTAIGGTQAGVDVHSVSRPFTFTGRKPKVLRVLSVVNPVTGLLAQVPVNRYTMLVRKGLLPLAGQMSVVGSARLELDIPAGSEVADTNNVLALISAVMGLGWQVADGWANTVKTGTI